MLTKCSQIYIDGTFKACPKSYYQILNFAGYLPDIQGIVPIFMIPVTSKTENIYNNIFRDIIYILKDNGINIDKISKKFMVDFEKSLINSIKKNFPNATIDGCFFHYSKLIWTKARLLGLCTKDNLKMTKILIFIFKLFPFIFADNRTEIFKKIKEYYVNDKYKKLLAYYEKNWINSNYINYVDLAQEEYLMRTNNYLERFHGLLNQSLETIHPKISYLIFKYGEYIKYIYTKITNSLIKKIEEKDDKFSVINDILSFMNKYNDKYKTKIDFNNILQSSEELREIIAKVIEYCLDITFDNINFAYENSEQNDYTENNNENNDKTELIDVENNSTNELEFQEFFPKKTIKNKKKRNYIDAFGEDNELKLYLDKLKLNRHIDNI